MKIWVSGFDLALDEHTRHADDAEDGERSNGVFRKAID